MKDMFGHEFAIGDVVGRINESRSITLARVMRFTPQKMEIVYPVMKYNPDKGAHEEDFHKQLVFPDYVLKMSITPEIQKLLDEKRL